MSNYIHFSSGRSGLPYVRDVVGVSFEEQANRHAAELHGRLAGRSGEFYGALEVNTLQDVFDYLWRVRQNGSNVLYMDFHAHGNEGVLVLGRQRVTDWRRQFGGHGLEMVFGPDARIEFHACSIGGGADGELFVADCAWTFLRVNGGSVKATTWLEFSYPYGAQNATPGRDVVAEIEAGGHVTLRGARVLVPARLRERQQAQIANWRRLFLELPRDARPLLSEVELHLADIQHMLQGQPSYRTMHSAIEKMEKVDRFLGYVIGMHGDLVAPPDTFGLEYQL